MLNFALDDINFEMPIVLLQAPFLNPDHGRMPFFDGLHEEFAAFEFECQECRLKIEVHVLQFISQADSWFRKLSGDEQHQILGFFQCRHATWRGHPIIESHDDGQPYFGLVECSACHDQYLLYVSFYERQPARYVAKFQGAARFDQRPNK